jgi:hypothetical protein
VLDLLITHQINSIKFNRSLADRRAGGAARCSPSSTTPPVPMPGAVSDQADDALKGEPPGDDGDWRLTNREQYLTGATLAWRNWTPPSMSELRAWRLSDGMVMETPNPNADPPRGAVEDVQPHAWDHDHCEFCWTKFMSSDYPLEQQEWRNEHPEILTAGYTLAESQIRRIWICPTCFSDFRDRFGWTLANPG